MSFTITSVPFKRVNYRRKYRTKMNSDMTTGRK